MMIKLSTARALRDLVGDDWREVAERWDSDDDFSVGNYRFIHEKEIDDIQREEIGSDTYTLGCFSSWCVASATGISETVVVAMQKAEAYDAVGQLVLDIDGALAELQQIYCSTDGYGHHFSHYDGSEETLEDYYVFRVEG